MGRATIVAQARDIAESYARRGLRLTVRQLYYQFVSRALMGSGQKFYKQIVSALAEARLRGEFPMDLIEDRGRDAQGGCFSLCEDDVDRAGLRVKDVIGRLPELYITRDRWYGQPTFVSVWVEKEALAGVFARTCQDLGVGLFACKGYPSVSALYQWLKHLEVATRDTLDEEDDRRGMLCGGQCREALILYFGDHDPDGFEIPPRSAMRNLSALANAVNVDTDEPLIKWKDGEVPSIALRRVALNMSQVRAHNPPPFDAKVTSSRYASYVREHGTTDAWELDALDPAVLQGLIRTNVEALFDPAIHETNRSLIADRRKELREVMLGEDWLRDAVLP